MADSLTSDWNLTDSDIQQTKRNLPDKDFLNFLIIYWQCHNKIEEIAITGREFIDLKGLSALSLHEV